MPNPLYIDNIDVYSAYGVYVMEDDLKGLVGMPSFKKVTSTDWHEQSGVDADLKDLVLGGRQLSISFHSSHRIPSATAQRFVDFLSQQVYHTFYLPRLQMQWRLRYVSSGAFSTNGAFDSFTLTFAEDSPLIHPTAPTFSLPETSSYQIDGHPFSYYGCADTEGTLASFHRLAGLKDNLSADARNVSGLVYDGGGTPVNKYGDVTMRLHLRTASAYDFWHDYHALFYAFVRPDSGGEARRVIADSSVVLSCYYKGSAVERFKLSDDGGIWCDFTVTFGVIQVEDRTPSWQYLGAEQGGAVVTEDAYPEFVVIAPPAIDGSIPSGGDGGQRVVRISELPEVRNEDMGNLYTIGVDASGRSVKVPVQTVAGRRGGGFFNLDNEYPLEDGSHYTLVTAVARVAADTSVDAEARNGMIVTFYDGSAWKTYRYKNLYDPSDSEAASSFADTANWEEFRSGSGGGGGGSESPATRIILQRVTPNLTASVGSQVRLQFLFDHVDSEGVSTGNTGTATVTVRRGGVVVKTLTRTVASGTNTLDVTGYCAIGINTVRLAVTVDTGLATQSAAIAWTVSEVKLKLFSDLTGCTVVGQGESLHVGYTLESGSSDDKTVVCCLDGVQLSTQTQTASVSSGSFSVGTASLSHGRHTLQLRASQSTGQRDPNDNEILLYSNLLYAVIGVCVQGYSAAIATMLVDMADGSTLFGPGANPVIRLHQYETLNIGYGAWAPSLPVTVALAEGGSTLTSASNYGLEALFKVRLTEAGTHSYSLTAAGTSQIAFSVQASAVEMGVTVPSGRTLYLDAVEQGHTNSDSNRASWTSVQSGVTTSTSFSGFSWSGDGWVDGVLRVRNGATAVIGYKPLQSTASGGSTVGFKFKISDVVHDDDRLISCLDTGGTGFYVTPDNIVIQQAGNVRASMRTAEEVVYDIAFVVWPAAGASYDAAKNARFVYIYIDGIASGCYRLDSGTTLFQSHPVNITIGAAGSSTTIDLYRVWGYQRALSDSELLDCFILDQDDNEETMLKKVSDNDILSPQGTVYPDSLPDGTRVMIVTGSAVSGSENASMASVLAAAHDNIKKKYFPCVEISTYIKGSTDRSRNFIARCNGSDIVEGQDMSLKLRLQGTSSLAYPVKNYRIYTGKSTMYVGNDPESVFGDTGTLAEGGKFAMHGDSAPVAVWCLKADYAESSSSHNTGMARLVNDTLKHLGIQTPAQRDRDPESYPYEVRTTVDGEPCILFYRESLSDTPVFLGKFNFNNDKSTEAVYGFTGIAGYHDVSPLGNEDNTATSFTAQQYKRLTGASLGASLTECWEFRNNEDPMGEFRSDDFAATMVDSDSGATVPRWTGTFEARYPDKDSLNERFESGEIVPYYLSTLVSWVKGTGVLATDTASQATAKRAKFRTELSSYFDVPHLCAYFVFTQMMACLDQMVKNMMMAFWYDRQAASHAAMGKVRAYMIFYDNDTILGVVNNGRLLAPYDVTRQSVQLVDAGGNPVYYYAGHGSVLWNNLVSEFPTEIRNAYVRLRSFLTNDKIFEYFDTLQADRFCERIYNLDAINKYVAPESMSEAAVSPYRDLMQGSRKSHRHYFVTKRLSILDNYWRAGEFYTALNEISFKGISAANSSIGFALRQDGNVEVQSDVSDSFVTNYPVSANTYTTITKLTPSAVGTIFHLYGVRHMTRLDISQWDFDQLNLGNFPFLEEFVFGVSGSSFVKPGFTGSLAIGGIMPKLRRFWAEDCAALSGVDLSRCTLIEEVRLTGSAAVAAVSIPAGAPLREYVVPAAPDYSLRLMGYQDLMMYKRAASSHRTSADFILKRDYVVTAQTRLVIKAALGAGGSVGVAGQVSDMQDEWQLFMEGGALYFDYRGRVSADYGGYNTVAEYTVGNRYVEAGGSRILGANRSGTADITEGHFRVSVADFYWCALYEGNSVVAFAFVDGGGEIVVEDTFVPESGSSLVLEDPSKIGSFTFENCPRINPLRLVSSMLASPNAMLSDVDITLPAGGLAGGIGVLTALVSLWNGQSSADNNLRVFGQYTVTGYVTAQMCTAIGYNTNNAGTFQTLTKIYGLQVKIEAARITAVVLQSYDPAAAGYNPAASICLEQNGYGTYVDETDPTKGWFMTSHQAARVTSLPYGTFNGKGTVTDTHGICGTAGVSYELTSFHELRHFTNVGALCKHGGSGEGTGAFQGCTLLAEVTLPPNYDPGLYYSGSGYIFDRYGANVQQGVGMFTSCGALSVINNLSSCAPCFFERGSFRYCASLQSMIIPSGVTTLGWYFCQYCNELSTLSLPEGMTSLSIYAFEYDSKITEVTIPSTMTDLNRGFSWNKGIVRMTCLAVTPPSILEMSLNNGCVIYVPAGSVDAYKAASGWSTYANNIQAITS